MKLPAAPMVISRRGFLMTATGLLAGGWAGRLLAAPHSPVRSAELRVIGSAPQLFINGQPHNPLICFMGPHRREFARDQGTAITAKMWATQKAPALRAFSMAASQGVHIHSFSVWMPWTDGKPDYADAEAAIEAVLKLDPEGILIPRISMNPPFSWREQHPGDLAQWNTGNGLTSSIETKSEARAETGVSVGSATWRREAERHLARFIAHLEAKYGGLIAGYHLIGLSYEWFYIDAYTERLTCCEPAFLESWRGWLRQRYETPEALRAAWGSRTADFENVAIPTCEERLNARFGFFRDPVRERKTIDFHEYQNVAVAEAIERFARVVKERSGKLVVVFYGYLFELGNWQPGIQQSGHLALGRLLRCPDIDIISAPLSYMDRAAGGIGGFMTAVDSAALHGKLWCNEDDTRTHRAPHTQPHRPPLKTPAETRGAHQRQFAQMFPRRTTCWYMDLVAEGWLADAGIWRDIGRLKRFYDTVLGKPSHYAPEIAVIADEKSNFALTQKPRPITEGLLFGIRKSLYRIGAPCGFYLLEDFERGLVPPAKLYVFLNCFRLSPAERRAIASQCAGKTAVFFYANGLIDETVDPENMEELLGAPLAMSMRGVPGQVRVERHALTQGVPDFGSPTLLSPVITLDGRNATHPAPAILARYRDDTPAAWITGGPYQAVYIGALTAPAPLLRNVARAAGVHIYCETNDVVSADRAFFGIHASSSGAKEICLPAPATVRDALSGAIVARGTRTWSVEMQTGETRLYAIDGKAAVS